MTPERFAELCEAHGLDPRNASVEDTLAQRDALQGAIYEIDKAVRDSGLSRHLPPGITAAVEEAVTLAELVERIIDPIGTAAAEAMGGEAEDTTG